MTQIQIGKADWRRAISREADIVLKNRFFEANPSLTPDAVSVLARPGLRKALNVGEGPIRALFSAPGAFAEDLFVVSELDLYRVNKDSTITLIGTVGTLPTSTPSMTATGTIGDTVPNYLYICDGGVLWLYTEEGFANGTLTISGAISNTETVTLGTIVYAFTTGSVDAGTPDGSIANPWLVKIGVSDALSLANLYSAINASGVAGTDYSTVLTAHPDAVSVSVTSVQLIVRALTAGISGNIASTETGANMAWGSATLTGGGSPNLTQVPMPDDVGALSVAHIDGYVIVIPTQDENINGRFYWIRPGETTVDPLSFATAERSPDAILQVRVFSDQIMFLGQSTTENWIVTGNADAPFQRFSGTLFDRGIWEGTAVQIKESVIVVDKEGAVLQIGGGAKVISNPSIEERIRTAIQLYNVTVF